MPVADALRENLPSILGVAKPFIPRSKMKPRTLPSSHLAHTTATSATGEFVILAEEAEWVTREKGSCYWKGFQTLTAWSHAFKYFTWQLVQTQVHLKFSFLTGLKCLSWSYPKRAGFIHLSEVLHLLAALYVTDLHVSDTLI